MGHWELRHPPLTESPQSGFATPSTFTKYLLCPLCPSSNSYTRISLSLSANPIDSFLFLWPYPIPFKFPLAPFPDFPLLYLGTSQLVLLVVFLLEKDSERREELLWVWSKILTSQYQIGQEWEWENKRIQAFSIHSFILSIPSSFLLSMSPDN